MKVALPCVAQFVVVLDLTIVAIALPAMQADFGLSTTALGWVSIAYTVVFGGCLLAAGRLADRTGRRRAFGGGLLLFAAASLGCGLAPGVGRAARRPRAAGAGRGDRLARCARARHRRAAGRPGAGAGAGVVDRGGRRRRGERLGARRSDQRAARVALGVPRHVPVCLAAAAVAPRFLREWRDPEPKRADVAGAVLVTAGITAIVLALTVGRRPTRR